MVDPRFVTLLGTRVRTATNCASQVMSALVSRTANFQPVGRWQSWNGAERALFKRVAGSELISWGYAEDDGW